MGAVVDRRLVAGAERRPLEVGELGGVGAGAVGQGIDALACEIAQVDSTKS